MIDSASDLAAVFFGPDFAFPFTRVRPAADDVTVMMIVGAVDDEALQQRAIALVRKAAFAAGQDVQVDDRLVAQVDVDFAIPLGTVLKVLDEPKRHNDGLEMEALLGSVASQ